MGRHKKEEITDGLRVVKGEDILPDNLTVDVLEGSLRISPKDSPAGCSRAVYLESVVDDLAASADAEAKLPAALREAVAHLPKILRPAHRRHISPMAMGRMARLPAAS